MRGEVESMWIHVTSTKCMKLLQLYTYFPGLLGPVALTMSYQKLFISRPSDGSKLQPLSIQNIGSPNDHQRLPPENV